MKDKANERKIVERVLVLKRDMDQILTQSFEDNVEFQHALKEAFESFIRECENKPAELLAKVQNRTLKMNGRSFEFTAN